MQRPVLPLFGQFCAVIVMYCSGFGFILIFFLFADQYTQLPPTSLYSIAFLQGLLLAIYCLGFCLILVASIQTVRTMTIITRKFVERGVPSPYVSISPDFSQETQDSTPSSRFRIIRATMPTQSDSDSRSAPQSASSPPHKKIHPPNLPITTPTPASSSAIPGPTASPTISPTITFPEALESIITRYNAEAVRPSFAGWDHMLMMVFPDLGKSFLYRIHGDQGIEFSEGMDESASVQVKIDSQLFQKMITKQINPIKAYSSGALEVKGEMKNLLKLRKLMF